MVPHQEALIYSAPSQLPANNERQGDMQVLYAGYPVRRSPQAIAKALLEIQERGIIKSKKQAMEIKEQLKLAKHIFRLLKVNEISFPVGRTNKGNLTLRFSESSEDFDIMLDSVPLSTKNVLEDENNIELKKMIEKYWFDERLISGGQFRGTSIESRGPFIERVISVEDIKNPRGRPKGTRNHGNSKTESSSK